MESLNYQNNVKIYNLQFLFFSLFNSRKQLFKQLSGVVILQALQVLVSAAIGFLIIRNISKEEYAIFNLLNNGNAILIGFSSIATTSIFIPFANRFGTTKSQLGITTNVFDKLSKPLLIIAIIAGIFYMCISSLSKHWFNTFFLLSMCLAIFSAFLAYKSKYYESAFKVYGDSLTTFKIFVSSDVVRLILVFLFITTFLKYTYSYSYLILMVFLALTSFLSYFYINKQFRKFKVKQTSINIEYKEFYWKLLKPLMFPAYFYHFSQFFRGWLIYIVSGTSVIAEAAALGRLMALFAMLDKAIELIIIPNLGATKHYHVFIKKLSLSFVLMFILCSCILLSAFLFQGAWLWILGEKYDNLGNALLWAVAAAGVERLSGLVFFGQLARGETKNQWWVPIFATCVYLVYVSITGMKTAEIATIGLFVASMSNLLAQMIIFIIRMKKQPII